MSLNDDEESAEASQGVRPRSWSCKGGCGGQPVKQASRRTIQGQTVRQPNESPAPPAMPDLTFSCISSPCSTLHQLSEHLPGPAALQVSLLNSPAAGSTAKCFGRTRSTQPPRSHIFDVSFPWPDSCPSVRETSTRMRAQGCLSPSAPSKSSRIKTNWLDSLLESANALPSIGMEHSGILDTKVDLKPFRMHVDIFPLGGVRQCAHSWSRRMRPSGLGASLDTDCCHLTFKSRCSSKVLHGESLLLAVIGCYHTCNHTAFHVIRKR